MSIRHSFTFLWATLLTFFSTQIVFAQGFDQQYDAWKTQQKAHDTRLNSSASNHYLSKPTQQSGTGVKVNINSATAKELQQLHGVGEKKALAIVEYRQQYGKFASVDDLQKVKGIGPKFIEKNRDRLAI